MAWKTYAVTIVVITIAFAVVFHLCSDEGATFASLMAGVVCALGSGIGCLTYRLTAWRLSNGKKANVQTIAISSACLLGFAWLFAGFFLMDAIARSCGRMFGPGGPEGAVYFISLNLMCGFVVSTLILIFGNGLGKRT